LSAITERLSTALADRYRLERELGQGGMATVYLAEDVRHRRKVAVKVLHPELSAVLGPDRFLKEIELTANLQHPHILPLFDSGAVDGLLFYVMPFVEGETLRSRLTREHQLPIAEAVRIARDVADALEYAHKRGVVHRDIKPENILLHEGRPQVADFGIALAVQQAGGSRMTQTGMSLGTPQYMAPEQAMGDKGVDARADVYALGAVTYEMLTGEPPFTGPTAQAIVAKVMTETPRPLSSQRPTVPAEVEAAVLTALQKLPADRFASAAEFASALGNPAFRTATHSRAASAASGTPTVNAGWKWAAAVLTLMAAVSGGVAIRTLARSGSVPRDIGLPPTAPIRMEDTKRNFAAAHDGTFIVYEAKVGASSQLWYRSLIGTEVRAIGGTEGAFGTPRISPDDKRVAFVAGNEVKVVSLAGGAVTPLARAVDPSGGSWLAGGQIFFGDDDGRVLRWIDSAPGPGRSVSLGALCILPQPIGTGELVLCGGGSMKHAYAKNPAQPNEKLFLHRSQRATGSGPPLLLGSDFRIVERKYLVYISLDGTLMATRLENVDSLTVGRSVALVQGVRRSTYSGAGHFDITDNGALVYVPGINAEAGRLVRWSSDGRLLPLPVDEAVHLRFTPSPDGQRLGTVVEGLQQEELRLYDLRTGTSETVDQGFFIGGPGWNPDGRRIAYRKQEFDSPDKETVYLRRLDSPEKPQVLLSGDYRANEPNSYLADNFILLGVSVKGGAVMLLDPTTTPPKLDSLPFSNYFISISPDRKWIAYQNQGARGILLQPWPGLDRRYQVDPLGGEPRWRSATELVYLAPQVGGVSVRRVTINPASSAPVSKPEVLFTDPRFADTPGWSLAVMPGGDVIYLQMPAENLGYYVRVVPNWVKTMKRAVDAANQ
jgi:eukaryotic-like serine/threonine-protein kinase